MTIQEKLTKIQEALKVPKKHLNKFGNYYYRSAEDILDAVKPLLIKNGASLVIRDDLVFVGNRYYVKATCEFGDGDARIIITAFARESESKKGMDEAQITGSVSSYARKYALNGLFLIDDSRDSIENGSVNDELSYSEIKDKLSELHTIEDIDEYSKTIKKSLIGIDDKKRDAIAGAFRIRRAEIDNS